MVTYNTICQLCDKEGIAVTVLEAKLGFGRGSIGKLKNGGDISASRLKKIADYFKISTDYLMTGNGEPEKKEIALTTRDERDIEKILDSTREQLLTQEGLMFEGDPATPEAIDSLLDAMQIGMEMAKKKNKEKYTPKKYKKD